ncbi:hypothetical protein H6F68_28190 [Trichocoleus sp. FACHB-262]|nr:hypothetical protein [Trichocoleus sp. FACHB-262]
MILLCVREAMLSRPDLKAAVFIGGMEGVEIEYEMFKRFHPEAKVLPVAAPGGAAQQLAIKLEGYSEADLEDADFAHLFHNELNLGVLGH